MRKVLIFTLVLLLTACRMSSVRQVNQAAEDLLWTRPDSTIILLQSVGRIGAGQEELMVRQLLLQAARMRLTQMGSPDEWNQLITYFEHTNNRSRTGECCYYKAVGYSLQHETDSTICYLQQADAYQDALTPVYIGMIRYRLGVLNEENQQYTSAFEHYTQALPALLQTNDSLLLGCCYRDLARMSFALGYDSLADTYFAQALQMADSLHHPILSLDIAIQEVGNSLAVDSAHLLHLYQTLGREEQVRHLQSKSTEMDILQEHLLQEKRLRQQRHWGLSLLLVLVACVVLLLIVLRIRWQREQYRHQLLVLEQNQLRQNLNSKREVLRSRLRERLTMMDQTINWETFYAEFDAAYDGLLTHIKDTYPDLTEIDIRYIALTCMHFDTSDICLLLNLTKRTIYNRRQILRQRLNLSDSDLDIWLVSLDPTLEK